VVSATNNSSTRHYKSPGFCLQNAKVALNGAQSPLRKTPVFALKVPFNKSRSRGKKRKKLFKKSFLGLASSNNPPQNAGFPPVALAGACQFGTAWAGFRLVNCHHAGANKRALKTKAHKTAVVSCCSVFRAPRAVFVSSKPAKKKCHHNNHPQRAHAQGVWVFGTRDRTTARHSK
jgi:hypothetical protein